MNLRRIFCLLSLMLCVNVCPVFAKPPITPKIVFTSARARNPVSLRDIYIMDTDGHNQVNLTNHHADDSDAVWSPTGEHILFVSDREGIHDLYLMDPDGSNVRRIFKEKAYRETPIWSPDGKQIAYVHNRFQLKIAKKNGTEVETLTDLFAPLYAHPVWLPDGSKIAFDVPLKKKPLLIDLQTRTIEPLLPELQFYICNAEWSLDGKRVAFVGIKSDENQELDQIAFDDITVHIVNHDGTGLKQIVDEGAPAPQQPAWSPRGDALLYQQGVNNGVVRSAQTQLFKVSLERPNPKQLTDTGRSFRADWFDPIYALPVSPQPQLLTTTWGDVKKR